ncbi:MAG: WhiB family transcriptional regulator [Actinomycetota bacterium]
MRSQGWRSQAACLGHPPDWWIRSVDVAPPAAGAGFDELIDFVVEHDVPVEPTDDLDLLREAIDEWIGGVDQNPHPYARTLCTVVCPVRVECVTASLDYPSDVGMFGGFGQNTRRLLRRRVGLVPDAQRLSVVAGFLEHEGPVDSNGPGATCGRTSTYGRGCRCLPCRHASAFAWRSSLPEKPARPVVVQARHRIRCEHVDVGACTACRHRTAATRVAA